MRAIALTAGLLTLALIWLGPLLGAWRASFAAGMVAHMGVVAIASPLIAIGLPDRLRPGARMPAVMPVLASLIELMIVWGWHAPILRAAADASLPVTVAEQLSFLLAGLLLWTTSFGAAREGKNAAIGAVALLFTSMHMTLLGALLSMSQRALYGGGEVTCFGLVLDARQDQQFGGVVMLTIGAIVYLAGGVRLAAKLVSPSGGEIKG